MASSSLPNDVLVELTRAVVRNRTLHDVARWARTCRAAARASRDAVAPAYEDRRRLSTAIDEVIRIAPPDHSLLICDRWSTARRMVGAWLSALDRLTVWSRCSSYHDFLVGPVSCADHWRLRVWYVRPGRRRHAVALATTAWICHGRARRQVTVRRYSLDVLRADVDAEMRSARRRFATFIDRPPKERVSCRALGVVHGTRAVWFGAATRDRIGKAHHDDTLLDYRARLARAMRECGALRVEARMEIGC